MVLKMKTSFVLLVSISLALGFTSAFELEDHGHVLPDDEFARLLFKKLDNNTDDNVSFGEIKRIFTAMDLDEDGKATKTEFITLFLANSIGHAKNAMKLFSRIDTNNDGLLDLVDFRRFYSYFDTDGDNKVNEVEFVTTWIAMENSF